MIKTRMVALVLALMLLTWGVLWAGGGQEPTANEDGGFTLRIALSGVGQFEAQIAAFEKLNPKANVEVIDVPWGVEAGRDLRERQLLMISSGDIPDIGAMIWGKEFFREGVIMDLTDDIKKWEEFDGFTAGMLERMTYNNRIYAATIYPCAVMLHYNKDILAQIGRAEPPKTMAELADIGAKIDAAGVRAPNGNKVYAMVFEGGNWHTDCFFWANGGEQMTKDYSKTLIDSPESIGAFRWMQNMVKNGYAPKPDGTYDQLWLNNQVAFFAVGAWEEKPSRDAGLNFGAVPIPVGQTGKNYASMGGTELAIFKASTHKQEAMEFMRLFYRKDLQLTAVTEGKTTLPISKPLFDDPDFQDYWTSQNNLDYYMAQKKQWESTKYNFLEAPFVYPEASKIYASALERVLVKLEDPEKIMKEAAEVINKGIAQKMNVKK